MNQPKTPSLKFSPGEEYSAYVAPEARIKELKSELKNIVFEQGNFFLCRGSKQKVFWAQNIWTQVQMAPVESIKKAAQILKSKAKLWSLYKLNSVRRSLLVYEELPKVKKTTLKFPEPILSRQLGAFTLLDDQRMLFSSQTQDPMPNGEYHFEAPPHEPPSEAYLKLWEALVRAGKFPDNKDYCVDLGSCPGSWTQALLHLGSQVLSIDKAPIEISGYKKLGYLKKDAFKIDPQEILNPTWIFSDIICYPDKLFELAEQWLAAHPKAKFIFTIKFQKDWDREVVERFSKIPNSKVLHLFNNKHELCWMKI